MYLDLMVMMMSFVYVLCDTIYAIYVVMKTNIYLPPDSEPITDQIKDPLKVQLGGPMSFIGVSYRNMGEELQEQK